MLHKKFSISPLAAAAGSILMREEERKKEREREESRGEEGTEEKTSQTLRPARTCMSAHELSVIVSSLTISEYYP